MYRILVADDEPRQLKAFTNIIKSLRPNYEITMAGDGLEAYNELQKMDFDILLTDIKMPNMDGLELISKIENKRSKMKIVIISGFAEFEYAQKAISFGVNDYLVKPITKDSLEKMLNTIESEISVERIKRENEVSLKEKLKNSLPVYLEHQLNHWMRGNIDEKGIDEIASIFPFKGSGSILMTGLKGLNQDREDFNTSNLRQDVKFKMKETLDAVGHSISFFLEDNNSIMVTILNTKQQFNLLSHENERQLIIFTDMLKDQYDINGTMGISEKTDDIFQNISLCFRQAQTALDSRFYQNTKKIIYFQALENQEITKTWNTEEFEKELSEAIDHLDNNLCIQLTSKALKSQCPGINEESLKEIMIHMMLNLSKALRNVMTDDDYRLFKDRIRKQINQCNDVVELWHRIKGIIQDIIEILGLQRRDINAVIIQKCKKFIDEKYGEDLTLESLALKYHFNNAYFSNLFKEYVGISFTKYLTKVRVEKAQKLLVTTHYPMSDIAKLIGISDPAYFNRIFKKEVGISPNKYRQNSAHS